MRWQDYIWSLLQVQGCSQIHITYYVIFLMQLRTCSFTKDILFQKVDCIELGDELWIEDFLLLYRECVMDPEKDSLLIGFHSKSIV